MQTTEVPYVTGLALSPGVPVLAPKKILFQLVTEVPGCLQAFVNYTQNVGGRTLTISMVLGTENGDIYDLTADNSVDITSSGKTVISMSIPGGPRLVALNFSMAGPAGVDDSVDVKISGLPISGYTIL